MGHRLGDIAELIGGRLVGPDIELTGVSFDSRSTRPGELFVPIVADRDGHAQAGRARGGVLEQRCVFFAGFPGVDNRRAAFGLNDDHPRAM